MNIEDRYSSKTKFVPLSSYQKNFIWLLVIILVVQIILGYIISLGRVSSYTDLTVASAIFLAIKEIRRFGKKKFERWKFCTIVLASVFFKIVKVF